MQINIQSLDHYERAPTLPPEIRPSSCVNAIIPDETNIELAGHISTVCSSNTSLLDHTRDEIIEVFRSRCMTVCIDKSNRRLVSFGKIVPVGDLDGRTVWELSSIYVDPVYRDHHHSDSVSEEIYKYLLWQYRDRYIECTTTNPKALGLSTRELRTALGEGSKIQLSRLLDNFSEWKTRIPALSVSVLNPFFLIPVPFQTLSRFPTLHEGVCVCPKKTTGCDDPKSNTQSCRHINHACSLRVNMPLYTALEDDVHRHIDLYPAIGKTIIK